MKNTLNLGALALLSLIACNKDSDTSNGIEQAPAFSIADPHPGQIARFERIQLAAGDTIPSTFQDTLLLEVLEVNSNYIEVEERLSEGSDSQTGTSAVSFPGHSFSYRLSPKPTELSIVTVEGGRLDSRLFPSLAEQSHALAYQEDVSQAAELEGLRVRTPYLPINRTYKLRPSDEVLVANLNHEGRQHGLPGFTFVHDREVGLRFMLIESDLEGNATGWKLIE
ncbi:MAG: hypothetical protein AB8F78_11425 [Saprospiraceae bacterium]